MKITIFYFSGTGNTKWAVNEFARIAKEMDIEIRLISIEEEISNAKKETEAADVIGFAFPILGANLPNIVYKFINGLSIIADKPAFFVTTAGYIDGFGPFTAKKLIKNKGLKLKGYINLKMSINISTPKNKADFLSAEKLKVRMYKNKKKIKKLLLNILNNKKYILNIGPYLIPGIIIRKVLKKPILDNYLALSVSKEHCTKCMSCVKNCPTKSINYVNNNFEFSPSCTACMRCYNFCQTFAIQHFGKYADPNIYKRYKGPQIYPVA